MAKDDRKVQTYTLRAPRGFFEDIERCILIRPDGEIVTAGMRYDDTNRFATPRLTVKARTEGWKVRLARWALGLR